MLHNILRLCLFVLTLSIGAIAASVQAQSEPPELGGGGGTCTGEFLNPISDICWECLGPITIGNINLTSGDDDGDVEADIGNQGFGRLPRETKKYDYGNPSSPFCTCGIIPGITIGFWEPRRLMDMTKTPWCFPNLGGLKFDPGIGFSEGGDGRPLNNSRLDSWHVHYYIYPILSIMEIITDVLCSEPISFDIGYVTELDPVWASDTLAMIISPESLVFANPIAVTACTVDCAASAAGRSSKDLFWCMGCHHTAYPLTGNMNGEEVKLKGAMVVAQRMAFKLHKQLIMWTTATKDNLCEKSLQPLMDKRQYRFQLTQPTSITNGDFTCPNIGFPTFPYVSKMPAPIKGEDDFGVLLWGKRNCCAL